MATELTLIKRRFGETSRSDVWWLQPVLVFCGLTAFVIYTTWAAFQGEHYHHGPYLSPFYAPEIFGDSAHSWLGPKPIWWPTWLPFSPAFLILWAPAGFRLTCYYYRGAYYKAFWADPTNPAEYTSILSLFCLDFRSFISIRRLECNAVRRRFRRWARYNCFGN